MMDTQWFKYVDSGDVNLRRRYIIVVDMSETAVRYRYPSERVVRELPRSEFSRTFYNYPLHP